MATGDTLDPLADPRVRCAPKTNLLERVLAQREMLTAQAVGSGAGAVDWPPLHQKATLTCSWRQLVEEVFAPGKESI